MDSIYYNGNIITMEKQGEQHSAMLVCGDRIVLLGTDEEVMRRKTASTNCVDLQESTIKANQRFFASYDDVPKQAYTMGIKNIMDAKTVLVVVSGEGKADIVKKAFFGPVVPEVPASILQMHQDVTIVIDEDAASLL